MFDYSSPVTSSINYGVVCCSMFCCSNFQKLCIVVRRQNQTYIRSVHLETLKILCVILRAVLPQCFGFLGEAVTVDCHDRLFDDSLGCFLRVESERERNEEGRVHVASFSSHTVVLMVLRTINTAKWISRDSKT